mmetsp:Transcript_18131/g.59763  ORF Transcript_18131/g.59763 Transcript_18131/m.59763 type:complete len:203 (+) Transcript_18131:54-662(+)
MQILKDQASIDSKHSRGSKSNETVANPRASSHCHASVLLERLRGDALAQAGDVERALVPLRDAAGHRTVVARLVGPRVAVISAHPHKELARDAGEGERLARPRVLGGELPAGDAREALHAPPRGAAVVGAQGHVAVAQDDHRPRVPHNQLAEAASEARCLPAGRPALRVVGAVRDAAAAAYHVYRITGWIGDEASDALQELR